MEMESHRHSSVSLRKRKRSRSISPSPPTGFPLKCVRCGHHTVYTSPPPPAVLDFHDAIAREAIFDIPIPKSQKVDPLSDRAFQAPSKPIQDQKHVHRFQRSATCENFLGFVAALSESVRSHKVSDPCHVSPAISAVVSTLQTLISFVDEIPPAPQSFRLGNLAYRTWYERMHSNAESYMIQFLPPDLHSSTVELVPYFTDSFGNADRIDYGTGNETHFAAWLYCLARIGVVKEVDYQALVTKVFVKYLELMKKLQLTYSLEPADPDGAWGLDDYHFLPFIFGSSQLIGHKYIKPKSTRNEDIVDNFSKEYLYFSCIPFTKEVKKWSLEKEVKKWSLAEYSRMLYDTSQASNWDMVNSGLLQMYKMEVLQKVPIMQHFLFGSLIRWECEGK
ncbi:PREDICTED: probable serine/threonine-protein phosphatase 2A activator 1 [Ipomoea nil]|uniref:probable serine/threonine-protein phosphatase 2A activator 1 n=1 Tax=Ipomoea nil TaxID=35883 RepID=UPI0009018EB6|nr:PREDICTED: probable serine/threonine-protein phosphatase 2A activator 1 [Ipomoea nil]